MPAPEIPLLRGYLTGYFLDILKWNGDNFVDLSNFVPHNLRSVVPGRSNTTNEREDLILIGTPKGFRRLVVGDYVVKGYLGLEYGFHILTQEELKRFVTLI